jgi:hypothetical protein
MTLLNSHVKVFLARNVNNQDRSHFVTPEPIRFAQGKLREGSLLMGREMLSAAKHDSTGCGR